MPRLLALLVCLSAGLASAAAPYAERQATYRWDLASMRAMDTLDIWAGPRPENLRISADCVQGDGALAASLDLDPGEHLRLEHNFLDGFDDVGRYLHGFSAREEDFSAVQAVRFACKTELDGPVELVVRLWDRIGGWVDWPLGPVDAADWTRVSLAVAPAERATMDWRRVGGITFEFRAPNAPVRGTVLLDDLVFSTEPGDGLPARPHPQPASPPTGPMHSPPPPTAAVAADVHIIMFVGLTNHLNDGNAEAAIALLRESINRFRGLEHIEFWFYLGEFGMFADDPLPVAEQERLARARAATDTVVRWCERNGVPFYMGPGHITPIIIQADWMAEILDAAPTACRGVFMHEYSPEDNNQTGQLVALLDLLRSRDKVLILNNQSCYWFMQMGPHHEAFRRAVYSGRYRDTFVPMWENLLPASQGLCLGSCLGYWRAGMVSQWGVSAQSWGYANLNHGLTHQMPAHQWLRMFVSAVALGATYFEIEPDWPFNGEHLSATPAGGYLLKLDSDYALPFWADSDEMRALRWFDRLLRNRALLGITAPEQLVSLPPVAFQAAAGAHFGTTGLFERALDVRFNQSHCPTPYEMSAALTSHDAFRALYRSQHHYDQTFPETPWGLVCILPPEADPAGLTILPTDGYGLRHEGDWLSPAASMPVVTQAFQAAAAELPFRAEDCFVAGQRLTPDAYQVVLMDPEERFPVGVTTELQIGLPGNWRVSDAVSGLSLRQRGPTRTVEIPPGGFRILRVTAVRRERR